MPDLSYSDAGTTAPSPGQPGGGWSWAKRMWDYAFTKVNAHWSNTAPANQHDSQAILGHATLPLTTARTVAAQNQFLTNDMLAKAIGDVMGAAGFTGALPTDLAAIAAIFAAASSTSVAGKLVRWDAATGQITIPAALLSGLVSDYKPSVNAAPGTITVAAGGAYESSTGAVVGPLGQQTAPMPPQPSGTHSQYVGISLSPATGTPVATAAAVDAALSTLVLPTANKPIAVVTWRGATTNPSGVIAAGDILDIRNLGGGGGGGAASGGVTTSDPGVSFGALGSFLDLYTLLGSQPTSVAGSGVVNGRDKANLSAVFQRVRGADPALSPGTPDLGQALARWYGGLETRPQDTIGFNGNNVIFNRPNVQIFNDGIPRYNAGQTVPCSPPSAAYTNWYVYADCTAAPASGSFTWVVSQTPPVETLYRNKSVMVLTSNGSYFLGNPYWYPTLNTVSSTQMVPLTHSLAAAIQPGQTIGAAGVATPATKVAASARSVLFPGNMQIKVVGKIQIYSATANTQGEAQFVIDGIPLGQASSFGLGLGAGYVDEVPLQGSYGDSDSPGTFLSTGYREISVMVRPIASGGIVIAQEVTWDSIQWGVPS